MSSILLDPRKTFKIELPSFPGSEVELYDGLLTYQVQTLKSGLTDYETGTQLLQLLIKSWSFVDENEQPIPVTVETLGKLPVKDFTSLMDEVTKMMDFLGNKKTTN